MAIAFRAAGAVVTGASPTVSVPAGTTVNDLLVLVTTGTATPATPSGWTQRYAQGAGQFLTVLTKYATAQEVSVAVSLSGSTSAAVMIGYSGAGSYDVLATIATGTGTTAATNTQTTTYANDYILSFFAFASGTATSISTPTGTTSRSSTAPTASINGLLIADELQAIAGISTARSSTIGASIAWSAISISFVPARTLYWVGGTGAWDTSTTGHWANSSGGSGTGILPPVQSEPVIFNGSSGTGSITIGTNAACESITTAGAASLTFFGGTILTIGGSGLNFTSSTITWSTSGTINFYGLSPSINTNGIVVASGIGYDASGGTLTLNSAVTLSGASTLYAFSGTINLNNFTVTCPFFAVGLSGTYPRAIAFGTTGNITTTGSGAGLIQASILTNFTYTGTPTINVSNNSATASTIVMGTTGGTEANALNLNFTVGTYALTITSGSVVKSLNFTGFTGTWAPSTASAFIYGNLTLVSGMTFTAGTNQWLFSATSGTQVITSAGKTLGIITQNGTGGTVQLAAATTLGTTATYTLNQSGTLDLNNFTLSTGLFSSSNSNTRSILFGTTGNITVTGSGTAWDTGTATNLTYTGTPTVNISNNSATATTVTAHTTSGTEANALNFNFTIGTYALTLTTGSVVKNIAFTGGTISWSPGTATTIIYGNITLLAGMTFTTGTGLWTLAATSGTQTITSTGKTLYSITQSGVGGTVSLADALTLDPTATYTLTNGTFTTNNQTVSMGIFSSNNSNTRALTLGTSTFTLTQSGGSMWNIATSTGMTLTRGTSTIVITTTSATTFSGGGLTYYNLSYPNGSGTYHDIAQSNIFNNLTLGTRGLNLTDSYRFPVGGTTTIQGTFTANGTSRSTGRIQIFSLYSGQSTISTAAISLSNVTFLSIIAAGTASPWSGSNFGDAGNNTNITFTSRTVYWSLAAGGTWSSNAWATSSGGAPSTANLPIPGDTVIIDNTGLTAGNTITLDSTYSNSQVYMPTLNITRTNASTFDFAAGGAFSSASISISSATTITNTGSAAISISGSSSVTPLVTINTTFVVSQIYFESNTITLNAALTTTALVYHSTNYGGTLNLNNFSLTCYGFQSSNTNTRVIAFGTGNITVNGSFAPTWDTGTATGLTYTGTPTVNFSNNSATATTLTAHTTGGTETNTFNFNVTVGTYAITITTASQFKSLDFTGFTGSWAPAAGSTTTLYGNLTMASGMTITAITSATWQFSNTSGTAILTSASKTLCAITRAGIGGTTQLAAATSVSTIGLTGGTLDLNNFTLSTPIISIGGASTKSIAFGTTGRLSVPSASGSCVVITGTYSYTGTSSINVNGAGAFTVNMGSIATEATALNLNITGSNTLTLSTGSVVKSLNFTGFTGTWAPTAATAIIYGNLTLVSGMTFTTGGNWTLGATSGTQVITSAGKILNSITQLGVGGTVQFSTGTTTLSTTGTYTLTAGTLDLATNTATLSTGLFSSSNSNTRVIAFGTGNITVTGSGTAFTTATATSLTYTGTPTVNISNNSATATTVTAHTTGGTESNALNFNFTIGTYALTLTTAAVVKSLNFTGYTGTWAPSTATATIYGNLTLVSGMTFTAGTSVWTLAATSGTQVIDSGTKTLEPITQSGTGGTVQLAAAATLGTTSTYTLTNGTLDLNNFTLSTGLFSSNNSNTRSILFGTTGNITTTGSGTAWTTATATSLTYTGTPTVNISNNSATATTVTAHTTNGTEANAFNFNFTIGTYTLALSTAGVFKNLDFTGSSITVTNAAWTVYGNLVSSTGMTWGAGINALTFAAASTTQTITSNTKTMDFPITIGIGSNTNTVQLVDALTLGSTSTTILTVTSGTFNANNFNVTTGKFNSSNANTRAITMGSGTWTLSGTGTVWNTSTTTGLTLTRGTSTITFSDTSTTAKAFLGGGLTYNNLTIGPATGIADYSFTGANTFNTIASSKTVAYSITLPSGVTLNATTWSAGGSAANLMTLKSSSINPVLSIGTWNSNSLATLNVTNAYSPAYANILYIAATGGAVTPTNSLVVNSTGITVNAATGSQRGQLITSGTSYTVPSDWGSVNTIHLIGAGGGGSGNVRNTTSNQSAGGSGGGGGGYTTLSNQAYTGGSTITYSVGTGGTGAAGAAAAGVQTSTGSAGTSTTWSASTAGGGGGGASSTASAGTTTGGTAGTGTFVGGVGGAGVFPATGSTVRTGGSGGGGAAGPNGAGKVGGIGIAGTTANVAGGGGGGNGGGGVGGNALSVSVGGTGGNNVLGTGGAGSNTNGTLGGGSGGSVNSAPKESGIGIDLLAWNNNTQGFGTGGGSGGGSGTVSASINIAPGAGGGGGGELTTIGSGQTGGPGLIYVVYTPSANVSTTVSGVTGTTALGTQTTAVTAILSGVTGTTALGIVQVGAYAYLSGVVGTTALGTATTALNTYLTGVTGTTALGTVTAGVFVSTTVSGVTGTTALGTTTQTSKVNQALTGVTGTTTLGTVTAKTGKLAPVSGVTGTTALGTQTTNTINNVSVTGVTGTTALGTTTTQILTYLTGVQGTTALGNAYSRVSTYLVGVTGTTQLGTASVQQVTYLTGVQGTTRLGSVTARGKAITYVTGVSATGYVGLAFVWSIIDTNQTANWVIIPQSQTPFWTEILT